MDVFLFISQQWQAILTGFFQHIGIVIIALPIAILIGVPVGIAISKNKKAANIVIYFASILMTIPSLALFGFAVIFLAPLRAGIGTPPAVLALVVYSFLPITRNTLVAIRSVDPKMIEAAKGMGMTGSQILFKIRLPLALPILMAGIRNAAVLGVSVTTVAYLIGARALGYFLFAGLSRARLDMVIVGALSVAILGVGTNSGLMYLENVLTPKGVKLERNKSHE
ncbi:MAG: ABC transporter permease [Spirochaetia bacterium]